ncbi:MAG TPA: glutamyl-tRNA reductase, partial [Oscillatoriaceae cyanobacterium]
MQVVVLGISHQTASVEVREKLSFSERQLLPALSRLLDHPEILEAVILSTCNRTEIYAVTTDTESVHGMLERFWLTEKKQPLETLFQHAIKAGKQVRTDTNIGRGSVSVSSAAVELACKHLGDLRDRIVLIYGAGKMSSHTIKALFQRGAQHVYIVNRTLERAQEAAQRLGGEAISMEAGTLLHAVADVVICCTSAPHYLLRPDNYPSVPGKQRLLIDIAVPRNIDPALAELPGVHVLDLDGLEHVARSNRE